MNKKTDNPDNIKIQKRLLKGDSYDKLSSFYSIFADSTRLSIINLLLNNELCVNDIAEILDMSQSRISHQLAVLRKHDIVTFFRQGKRVLYTLTDNHIRDLFETGLEHISEKDSEVYIDKKNKSREF